ncbi:MAG: ATP-binding cassette domain-containing protein [Dermatophilaceae bacterium]
MISLRQLTIRYADAVAPTLRDVTLEIDEGELVVVIGRTGSGKSTLLGALNGHVPHFTGGTVHGSVVVAGRDTATHRPRDLADIVGVVGQDPLAGFVTDTVEEELAYGMEQLALPPATMRKRVEETLDLLGIADLRAAPLRDLSGGQQQRVAIGSVLTTHPRLLVLDEPTSALDPTGAEEVLATITRLVHDLGVTVVIAEHRLERVLQYADHVLDLVDGQVRSGSPAEIMRTSRIAPPVVALGRWAGWSPLPVSIRDARRAAAPLRTALSLTSASRVYGHGPAAPGLTAHRVRVDYGRVRAVADVSVAFAAGRITALMGRNGSGKSSLLWALQGSGPRTGGTVRLPDGSDPRDLKPADRRRRVGLVPQNATDLLYLESVAAECHCADADYGHATGHTAALLETFAPGIPPERHPRDLSAGQQLALVLAVQLSAAPDALLLDEPTRGLDYPAKAALTTTLRALAAQGHPVVVSTHDVEFVADCADEVVVLAEGELIAQGPSAEVVAASPAFAPQLAKVLAPHPILTLAQLQQALPQGDSR